MYQAYNARPIPQPYRPHTGRKKWIALFLLVTLLTGYTAFALLRPLPPLKTTVLPPVVPAQVRVDIPWPNAGQSAFGADEYGLLATNGAQTPRPTASIAKVITALAILEKKPLQSGEVGPPILFTEKDLVLYQQYVAKDGAVVPVTVGQSMTEYQALQAMLLPSANNIADTAAIWAFGSMEAYTKYANAMVRKLGMAQTTINDASGFSPLTVSTASDLVRLGDAALDHPVLAGIMSQKQVSLGYGVTYNNVNNLLGQHGIRGIKTGNTEEAGGCYLAAADVYIGNNKVTVITAILGSTSRPQAMKDSLPIIDSAVSQFQNVHIVRAGQNAGQVTSAWGGSSNIVAKKDISVLSWTGTSLAPKVSPSTLHRPAVAGAKTGNLSLSYSGKTQNSDLQLETSIPGPTLWWRLTHPL